LENWHPQSRRVRHPAQTTRFVSILSCLSWCVVERFGKPPAQIRLRKLAVLIGHPDRSTSLEKTSEIPPEQSLANLGKRNEKEWLASKPSGC